MRKQFPFWVVVLLWIAVSCMSPSAFAAGMTPVQQVRAVQALEDALFSAHEEQAPLEARVSRLEQTVFGESDPDMDAAMERQGVQQEASPEKKQPAGRRAQKVSSSNASPPASLEARIVRLQKAIAASRPVSASAAVKPAAMPNASPENASAGASAGGQLPNLRSLESHPEALPGNTVSAKPSADETDYPTVTRMEQKVFGQTYSKEDITVRLSRLEKQVFHVVQGGALADRVDNLRLVVLGDAGPGDPNIMPLPPDAGPTAPYQATGPPAAAVGYPSYGFPGGPAAVPYGGAYAMPGMPSTSGYRAPSFYQPPSTYPSYPNYPNSAAGGVASPSIPAPSMGSMGNAASSGDMLVAMNEVEKQVLGRTYAGEPVNARLDRLETKFFHSTSPELPNEDRMQRVIAVASAGGAPESAKAKAKHGLQILLPIILTILPLVLL